MNSNSLVIIKIARQKKKSQQKYFKNMKIHMDKSYRIMKTKSDQLFHVDVVDLMVNNSFLKEEVQEEAVEVKIQEKNEVKIKVSIKII